ncbi:MAG: hypothetical protein Q7T54_03195 [Candidatus Levybacteria bacterium]|nr:hypothetical protein [Candidatus Levybacteria bacterium]
MYENSGYQFKVFTAWNFLLVLLIIIIGNLFIIDVALFWKNPPSQQPITATSPKTNPSITPTSVPSSCSDECRAEIKKEVAKTIKTPVSQTTVTSVKETFVTLGSGSSTSLEWSDIPGAQSYIDSAAYGKIKTVTFEVSLHTPTGNQTAYARLYNVTDSHPVWNSEVSIEGGTPLLKISSPITLDKGSKLYQVQMRTQLQSRTNLENARVHIVTY